MLQPLLSKAASKHEAIKGEECWSLLYEAQGDLRSAIRHRKNEVRLIKRLLSSKPRVHDYGPGDLVDRLMLLGILYHDSGLIHQAIAALREAKRICQSHRIKFDADDLLKEYSVQPPNLSR